MLSVLMLFLIPVGGGIPAGVLLANSTGLSWPITAGLYLLSDVILALAFEPALRLFVLLGNSIPTLARLGVAMKLAMARNAARIGSNVTNPFMLILIAFGVDPMTGRTAALAAGYGFIMGWVLAIAGDMLYYAVIALATLRLNTWVHNPEAAMLIILSAMLLIPAGVRWIRFRWQIACAA